jgi:fluoride exporter
MRLLLLASAGGAIGAGTRYLVSAGFMRWCVVEFPWATLTINVAGCFLMGVLVAVFLRHWPEASDLRIFLATGVLGGFTTFSAFAIEFIALMERKTPMAAVLYGAGSVGLSITACGIGLWLARTALA